MASLPARSSTVARLPSRIPEGYTTAHHVGSPPTSFKNPWPSFQAHHSFVSILKTRWSPSRNFKPVPVDRLGLPSVRKPYFTNSETSGSLKATWIGHASWLIETSTMQVQIATNEDRKQQRGVRILLDPVWSDTVGPYGMFGPKRFTPVPCTMDELPDIDAVVISHNHYDHLDIPSIKHIYGRNKDHLRFLCPLGLKTWFLSLGIGIREEDVTELDWWDGVELRVDGVGSAKIICTPSQHATARGINDKNCSLWSSWVIEEATDSSNVTVPKKLFFAGDTGYRTVTDDSEVDPASMSACPAFKEIGALYGPIDLALLPIGCYLPRSFMSPVHCAPEDSVCIHQDIQSKKSVGMHYGVFRGNLSAQYEEVTEPARRWRKEAEAKGLEWNKDVMVCDVGEMISA